MTRNGQKIACLTLFFSCFHPATGQSQSQKSQIWRVPVVGSEEVNNPPEDERVQGLRPHGERASNFSKLRDHDAEASPSGQQMRVGEDSLKNNTNVRDSLSRSGLLLVGSEAGAWGGGKISLKGNPGKEPLLLLDGIPLSSGFSGSRPEELVPQVALKEIVIYPFLALPGQPRRGISGAYNLITQQGDEDIRRDSSILVEYPKAVVVGDRQSINCGSKNSTAVGCLNLSWQWASRKGTQRVRDDNNTPFNPADDFESNLHHNDLDRGSVLLRSKNQMQSGVSLNTTVLVGLENKGINGLPLSSASSSNRGQQRLSFLSHSGAFLSPSSGRSWSYQLSGRLDSGSYLTSLQNNNLQLRRDLRRENVFTLGAGFSTPVFLGQHELRFFVGGHTELNRYESSFGLVNPISLKGSIRPAEATPQDSNLSGKLSNSELGAGLDILRLDHFLFRTQAFAHWISSSQQQDCGAFSPAVLCSVQGSKQIKVAPGAALEIQLRSFRNLLPYLLAGRSSRLPTPTELAGRPDGVVANLSLKPEFSTFFEAGFQSPFAHAGFYFANDDNLITMRQINPYLVKHDNASRARREGLFAQTDFSFGKWDFSGKHEQVWARFLGGPSSGEAIPYIPEWQSRLSFGRTLLESDTQEERWGRWRSNLSLSKSGPYGLDQEGLFRLSPPLLVGLTVAGLLSPHERTLMMDFRVDNLLDNRTSALKTRGGSEQKVAWSYLPALPIAGRTFTASLRLQTP